VKNISIGTGDYKKYYSDFVDPKVTLNIKGPLANLHFSFKAKTFKKYVDDANDKNITYKSVC